MDQFQTFGCTTYEHKIVRVGYRHIQGLEPLYVRSRVDIVFSGHVHSYERFLPMLDYQVWFIVN